MTSPPTNTAVAPPATTTSTAVPPAKKAKDITADEVAAFTDRVLHEGRARYRDLPWRNTRDPYAILLSEIMLQQTQVVRVLRYYDSWLARFPSIDALAAALPAEVLVAWQGLGYNRRALALKRLADHISETQRGILPATYEELLKLPGIGPATAAGVMAFAHNSYETPVPYFETNVRSTVLHELFFCCEQVCDKDTLAIAKAAAEYVQTRKVCARDWNYALLDYGAWLKKAFPNPSRRSKQHTKQSRFEGSFRQKRAQVLRCVLAAASTNCSDGFAPDKLQVTGHGLSAEEVARRCKLEIAEAVEVLDVLAQEGFIHRLCGGNGSGRNGGVSGDSEDSGGSGDSYHA